MPSSVPISEEQFLDLIIETAHTYGWVVAHFRPAMLKDGSWRTAVSADGKGFPDCILVRPPKCLFVETKSEKGKVSPEQKEWGEILKQCPGIEYYLWRPSQFDNEIVKVLER